MSRAGALALTAAVVLAYLPALGAGYVWDDDQYLTANPLLRDVDGLRRIWTEPRASPQYYPLVFTTFWLERRLWGVWAGGYHAVNVLLHLGAALLAGRVLERLRVPGAALAAALFALHPVHVESVAWVTERKNVLSGVLYLASLLLYLGGRRAVALLAFLGALLAKSVTASLPVVVLLLAWAERRRIDRTEARWLGAFFLLGAAFGLHTAWLERDHVGASGGGSSLAAVERWLVVGRVPWFYLGKLLWPSPLVFVYPRWVLDPRDPTAHLYPLATMALVGLLYALRGRIGRWPLVAALYFGVTLAPASGLFDVYPFRFSFVADHFQYLASLGPLALVAAGVTQAAARAPASAARVAATVVLGTLAALTARQALLYRDAETLWRHTLAHNPRAWLALNNLAALRLTKGDAPEAEALLRRSLALRPDNLEARNNLGMALQRLGRPEDAMAAYRAVLAAEPAHLPARYNLALALARAGRLDEAVAELRLVVRQDPADLQAQWDLGRALALLGRHAEAVGPLRAGLPSQAGDPLAARELAHVEAAARAAREPTGSGRPLHEKGEPR